MLEILKDLQRGYKRALKYEEKRSAGELRRIDKRYARAKQNSLYPAGDSKIITMDDLSQAVSSCAEIESDTSFSIDLVDLLMASTTQRFMSLMHEIAGESELKLSD